MTRAEQSQALLIVGSGPQLGGDLQHVFSSVELARQAGHQVAIKSLWTPNPLRLELSTGTALEAGLLDEAKSLELADIELTRYESLADEKLTARELHMRQVFRSQLGYVALAERRGGLADVLRQLGGAAVIGGSELGVNIAAGYYEDLRQLGNQS